MGWMQINLNGKLNYSKSLQKDVANTLHIVHEDLRQEGARNA